MGFKIILSLLFIIFTVLLLVLYWFIPITTTEFRVSSKPSDFDFEDGKEENLQFYENMRFPKSRISYKIEQCPLQKKDDMLRTFEIISEKTILIFYETKDNEEISVVCDSKAKIEGGLFIAGEGGPINITKAGEFNVITKGKILLIKQSSCPNPNVGIHELLHVLGFNHSENPNDIMYPISKCGQTIGSNKINLINTIYSVPSYPDLVFESVSAIMHGKYLDANMSIKNNGLQDSIPAKIKIYADDKFVKEIELESLNIGHGRMISLTNVWITQISIEKLKFVIDSNFEELKKENNKVLLEIKK